MTQLAGDAVSAGFTSHAAAQVGALLLPLATALWFRYAALWAGADRAMRWINYRRTNRVISLLVVAAWSALWDLRGQSGVLVVLERYCPWWLSPTLAYWVLPIASIAAVQLFSYSIDTTILDCRWTLVDILRLACWSTVCPTISLLMVGRGFRSIFDGSLWGIPWIASAGIVALVGIVRLRSAQGIKLRRVKSGTAYNRAFRLAKKMGVKLGRVYIVPGGRGSLTNAYGLWQAIALTDNFGKYLSGTQLDFVIGHELAHVKQRHGRRNLRIVGLGFLVIVFVSFLLPDVALRFRSLLDLAVIILPLMSYYFFSRRFEYEADRISVEFTGEPEVAIRALANLYRMNGAPTRCHWLIELFMTHPSLWQRAEAIAVVGQMPAERIPEILRAARLPEVAIEA
jgi:Zn-dependent protease with chaperone function